MTGIGEGPYKARDLTTEQVKERPKAANPVKVCDTTFRDGHQSCLATRMRTEDMEWMAEEMNRCGFYSMEVWGGATFDVPHRFLGEDPWDRPRILKKLMPDTPLQMLLRGQNLVAYRNHPDDLVDCFVENAADAGIDIFRVFDAVNDERNHERAAKAIKKAGKHYQGAICYSLTQPRMGGPVYSKDYYVKKALTLRDLGADSICIKDQAGLISPYDAYELIKALKEALDVPIELHTHYTSGQGSMSLLKAIEAGVDIIDTALSPFALRSSQPAIEPLVVALYGTDRDTGLDIEQLFKCGQMVEQIAPKYRDFLDTSRMSVIDAGVLVHQIPGGMTTNLVSQLREADALDRLDECRAMTAKTRAELGYPPLVTPTSQIVGVQAVQNTLLGPYKFISKEVKDYCWGLYGKPPVPIDPEIQKMVLKGYERGEEPITCRAADMVEPELEKAREAAKDIAKDDKDMLTYALYPTTGMRFLRYKYGLDKEIPSDWKPPRAPKTMEEIKREDELIAKAKAGKLVEKVEKPAPAKGPGLRVYNVFVGDEYYQVEVEPTGGARISTMPANRPAAASAAPPKAAEPVAAKETKAASAVAVEGAVLAPMPGMIIRYEVEVGQQVKAGDTVVILEAMKMETTLPAPIDGTVKELRFKSGDRVVRDDVLAVIG
ncbi:MAG: pyruvate carboxylase subunit B [Dehalococcoidia bacterium]|jgi:pyruvate carboxylase subunit B|nr:pyruvate carboxylase subunit B [Chloroflexota bacterium]MCK4242377.1 pyruvate carboxylase subunit B [Dehalococcoidia bacterium]